MVRAPLLSLVLAAFGLVGCWSAGVIPKESVEQPPEAKKRDSCDSDAQCVDDLVCDQGRCISWHRMSGSVPEVTQDELVDMLEAGAVQVLDVRTKAEFAMGHVEGAINVPIAKLDDRIGQLGLDPNLPVVSICLTAHRSIAATRLLQRHGYEAYQLQGGWIRAKKKKFPKSDE